MPSKTTRRPASTAVGAVMMASRGLLPTASPSWTESPVTAETAGMRTELKERRPRAKMRKNFLNMGEMKWGSIFAKIRKKSKGNGN